MTFVPDRLAPGPFTFAAIAVYALSFLSQSLMSAPVLERAGLIPFALTQAVLIIAWYILHVRRLRDANRAGGMALGIALIYALGMILLLLLMVFITAPGGDGGKDGGSLIQVFAMFYILAVLFGDPQFNFLGWYLIGFFLLMMAPVLVAFGYSTWVATRPRALGV